MEHTKTDWMTDVKEIEDTADIRCPRIYMRNGPELATVECGNQKENIANAAFIVRACNSFDELLAVCEAFINELGPDGYYPIAGKTKTDAMRAAIQKARAE